MAEENATEPTAPATAAENGGGKREREERGENEEEVLKKQKVKKEGEGSGRVVLGPKDFGSSVEMFDYFFKLLHHWPHNVNLNKYESMVLLELLEKGGTDPKTKIGVGVKSFQVRNHPIFKSRCFFLIREDETVDDLSFRKCVDHILPLPEDMQIKHNANKVLGGKGRGGGWKRGRGRGNGGKSRN